MKRSEIEQYVQDNGYHAFYSDNYWIKNGESDYSGTTLCEAYCRIKYPNVTPEELFNLTMQTEYELHKHKRLGICGKTFKFKDELKQKFRAKFDRELKLWWVDAQYIKDPNFHDYCYTTERNFSFRWLNNE